MERETKPIPTRPWKILLVEDDEDDYILTGALLQEVKRDQFELVWAHNYETALELLHDPSHDVLLVDYLLDTHNGLDLVREAINRGCKAPIIVFTGQDSYEVDIEAMKIGAVDYLVKGQINAVLLERTIRYAIEYKQAKEALQKANDELEMRVQERTHELAQLNEDLRAEIQERRRAEEALSTSETKFRTLAESTSTAILIVQDAKIRYANTAAKFITGYSPEELNCMEFWQIAHPDYRQITKTKYGAGHNFKAELYDQGGFNQPFRHELKLITKEGEERWGDVTSGTIEFEGRWAWVITVFDITQRDLAEKALRKAKDELEIRVAERTAELQEANQLLQVELVERQRAAEERERLVSELDAERARLSTIISNAPVAITVTDEAGNLHLANPVAERLYRTGVLNEKEKRSFADLDFYYLDGRPLPIEENPVLRSAIHGETQINLEVKVVLSDGQPHYLLTNSAPILDRKNNIQGAVAIFQDISERKKAEVALRQARDELELRVKERTRELARTNEDLRAEIVERMRAEELIRQNAAHAEALAEISQALVEAGHNYQAVFDVISLKVAKAFGDGCLVWLISEDGQYLEPAAFYHLKNETLRVMHEFLPDIQHPVGEGILGQVIQTGTHCLIQEPDPPLMPAALDQQFQAYYQTAGISSILAAPIKLDGKPAGVIELVRDSGSPPYNTNDLYLLQSLSARIVLAMANIKLYKDLESAFEKEQTMRRQLVQAEKHSAMGRMVASVAHELNNPIQTVQNCLYLTQQDIDDGSPIHEYVEMALSETHRVSKLVTQLREIYRPSKAGPLQYLEVNKIILEVKSLLVTHLQHEKVVWRQGKIADNLIFAGISDQIKQVFLNICLNAIEAMQPNGGLLEVDTIFSENRDMVGIKFTDDGPGISPENLSQIFEPFFTTKDSGTGLGLSICYDIIQRHSGEITIESELGTGSTFTVWLPVIKS
jgi:PAS domain S-box-containing protein